MLTTDARGVYANAPTPFTADGAIDYVSVGRVIDTYRTAGVDGLTILGVMGEAAKLDHVETRDLAREFIRVAVPLPIIVGVSAPGFATMRSLAHRAMEFGGVGVVVAPLPTLKTEDQIITYYRQVVIAIGADVPFVIQDCPFVFNVVMTRGVIQVHCERASFLRDAKK